MLNLYINTKDQKVHKLTDRPKTICPIMDSGHYLLAYRPVEKVCTYFK